MAEALLIAFYLQIPVVIGGVLHMLVVMQDWCPALKKPVYAPWFGANKTWRGFVLVPLLTTFGALCLWPFEYLQGSAAIFGAALPLAGFIAGLGYMLAELPNSLLKRRLGIAPGSTPEKARGFFIFLDQLDSGIGVAIAYFLYPGFAPTVCLLYALTFPLTALLIKRLLFISKLKTSPV